MNKNFKTMISRGLIVAMLVGGASTMMVGCSSSEDDGTQVEMLDKDETDFQARGIIREVYGYGSSKTSFQFLENQVIAVVYFNEEDIANVTQEQLDIARVEDEVKDLYIDNGYDIDCTIYIYDEDGKVKLLEAVEEPTEDTTEEQDTEEYDENSIEGMAQEAYDKAKKAVEEDMK